MTRTRRQVVIQHLYNAVCKSTFFKSFTPELLWGSDEIVVFISPGFHSVAELSVKVENDGRLVMAMMQEGRRMEITFSNAESFSAMDFDDFFSAVQDVLCMFKFTLPPNEEDNAATGHRLGGMT